MSTPVSLQKRASVLRRLGLVAVVLIPLAFAGLFVGALAQSDSALDRIPAAVVNNDKMITTTDADGNEQIVFAGRQLVTELTGADGFDWTITNEEDAQALLDSGKVYAVLTVPSDFSESILSISGDDPVKADISIATDDSHSYLTGSVAQVVGQTMTDTFGREITKQYLAGLYDGMGQLGSALSEAADGAGDIASGASQFSSGLTEYTGGVDSLAEGVGPLSTGLTKYTNGVDSLASGATSLSSGLTQYAGGVDSLAAGASSLSGGVTAYTNGVDSLADGLSKLNEGTSDLTALADGITAYTTGATQLSDGIDAVDSGAGSLTGISDGVAGYTQEVSSTTASLNELSATIVSLLTPEQAAQYSSALDALNALSTSGGELSAQTTSGISQLQSGISSLAEGGRVLSTQGQVLDAEASTALQSLQDAIARSATGAQELSSGSSAVASGVAGVSAGAAALSSNSAGVVSGANQISSGASELAAGSPELNSGVNKLASGAEKLAAGSAGLNSGAFDLTSGVSQLATGLQEGADKVPATDADAAAKTADVVVEPVGVNVTTANAVTDVGQGVATFFVPLGLWIGALAVFLVLKPVSRRALASTARNGRLVAASIGRAGVVTALQALLLVGLLHGALGVAWSLLPATLLFSIITALAFTAFHYLLTIGLGRGGLVVSLFALAIQVTSTGGIYPVELLSTPFQVISPFLPLTWAVSGMQGIIAGGAAGTVVSSALILLAFGVGSVILALFAIRRTRRADVLGLVPLPA